MYFEIAGRVRSPKIPVTAACGRLFHWGRHEAQGQGQGRRQEVLTVIAQDADDVLYLSADEPDTSAGWVRESATRWRRPITRPTLAGVESASKTESAPFGHGAPENPVILPN